MFWQELLRAPARLDASLSLRQGFAQLEALNAQSAFELAVVGGHRVATPGQAFLLGYQAALRALYPQAPRGIGALCATEGRNLRPAQIETRFADGGVSGQKGFLLGQEQADWALVAAREEAEGESPRLAMLLLDLTATGVRVESGRPLAMIPDVPHGKLLLDQAPAVRLAGDGWDDYAKPFRSLEDLYVHSAMLAWLLGLAQSYHWPQALQLRLIGALVGAQQLSQQDPLNPLMHVQLAALLAQFEALQESISQALEQTEGHWAQLWQRDKAILQLATTAREARLQKALALLADGPNV